MRAMKKFDVHGNFLLTVEGQLFVSRIRGPFNVEFTRAYMRTAAPIARTLAAVGPWAGIIEYLESALFPLESAAIMRERTIAAATELRLVAYCWVVPPTVEGYGVIETQARHVYEGVIPFEIFENIDDARTWIMQRLPPKKIPDSNH
jgi:hypothetical protein